MMSQFHCSCGFASDSADEFGDHARLVFARDDNIGIDGRAHTELAAAHGPGLRKHSCACGFQADDMPDFDDHLLIVFIPEDNTGNDGERHVPVNTSTPIRWHVRRAIDD
jgi:hypothetical protein